MISENSFNELCQQPKPIGVLQLMDIKRNPDNGVYTAVAQDENRKSYVCDYLQRPSAMTLLSDLKTGEFEPVLKGCQP